MSIRVLIVDDDPAYLEVLEFFLEKDGTIEADAVTSAKEALERMSSNKYEVIVSDYLMPEMDGLDFLKILRIKGETVPFIMLTGKGKEDVAMQALNNGANFYVQKGGDPQTLHAELVGMIRQSVDKRRAESEVEAGERFLSNVFSSIQDGISVLDNDYTIRRVNPTMERWYPEALPLVGKKCFEAYRGRSGPCPGCPVSMTIATGNPSTTTRPKVDSNGAVIGWMDVHSLPLIDRETGAVVGVVEHLRDVTDRLEFEAALKESESRYRSLIELANEGILTCDKNGLVSYSNSRMAEILRLSPEDMLGKAFLEFVAESSRKVVQGHIKGLGRGERRQFEVTFRASDDTHVLAVMNAVPTSSDQSEHTGFLAVARVPSDDMKIVESILASESKFAKVFQSSPEMMVITRAADGVVLEANEAFLGAVGLRRDEAIGRRIWETGFLDEQYSLRMLQALDGGEPYSESEITFEDNAGRTHAARLHASLMDIGGEKSVLTAACDTTAQKEVISELQRQRQSVQKIVESSPDPMVIIDLQGVIVECNDACVKQAGLRSKADLVGRSVAEFLDEESSKKVAEAFMELQAGGAVVGLTLSIELGDGREIQAEASGSLVRDSSDAPTSMVFTLRDITERRKYEESLRHMISEKEVMERIVERSPVSVFLWRNEKGWPVEFVSSNVKQFGYAPPDLMFGKIPFADMVHPDDIVRVEEEVKEYSENGIDEFIQEYRLVSPSGEVFWVDDRTSVVRDTCGKASHFRGVLLDVTESRKYERALKQANEKLNLLGSITRHDLLNNLSVVLGWIDIILNTVEDGEVKEHLQDIRSSARNMKDILEFTSHYQGIGIKEPAWIKVREAVSEGVGALGHEGVPLAVLTGELEIFADPMLERVFSNLVDNSLRHGERVTRITVTAEETPDGLLLIYEDDGVGIQRSAKQRIFDRGYGKHTGFGLYLVREILNISDIRIQETGTPGEGARFELLIPPGSYRVASETP